MNHCHAVLLDTVSIQRYVFESNKLKENLGASFLVEDIYDTPLKEAVFTLFNTKLDLQSWREATSDDARSDARFEVGYIGGGNALFLFQERTAAEEFLKLWTRSLLVHCPGLVTAACFGPLDLNRFQEGKESLFSKLRQNKASHVPITSLPTHGITAQCTHSGISMEAWSNSEQEYVSSGTYAKIEAAVQSQSRIHAAYGKTLGNDFCFTDQLEKLGQISGEESHIAIVHIDGNGMGERFKRLQTLKDVRKLSVSVADATAKAFAELVKFIVLKYDPIMESLGFDDDSKDGLRRYPRDDSGTKKILPLRPIILGGDDLTFVCDGRLGIYFARQFIGELEKMQVSDQRKLTACAGVAVTKAKYPFYRGYQLAEELCRNAKLKRHQKGNDESSYIDFHISTGGFSGNLQTIREKHFAVQRGNLLFRPYRITSDRTDPQSFDLLIRKAGRLKENFPNNKIKELRQILTLSEEAGKRFVREMKYRGRPLPELPGTDYATSLFQNSKTPYFDMIELVEFYPDFEFPKKGDER